jgi:hypothetical protein
VKAPDAKSASSAPAKQKSRLINARSLKNADRVWKLFFIFNQGEVLRSNVSEKLRRCFCLRSARHECFVSGNFKMQERPFIDSRPDLVKTFLKRINVAPLSRQLMGGRSFATPKL